MEIATENFGINDDQIMDLLLEGIRGAVASDQFPYQKAHSVRQWLNLIKSSMTVLDFGSRRRLISTVFYYNAVCQIFEKKR